MKFKYVLVLIACVLVPFYAIAQMLWLKAVHGKRQALLSQSVPGLVSRWALDDGSGSTAFDASGYGNTGYFSNSAPTWTSGKIGGALRFVGAQSVAAGPVWGVRVPGDFTCTGLAYDPTADAFWVGDFDNSRLVKVSRIGAFLGAITNSVLSRIQGIAFDPDDDTLWTASAGSNEVHRFSLDGTLLTGFAASLSNGVNGIAVDTETDTIWVSPLSGPILKVYTRGGGSGEKRHQQHSQPDHRRNYRPIKYPLDNCGFWHEWRRLPGLQVQHKRCRDFLLCRSDVH
ncbi:MAG TPA: hypothetical protein VD837_07060 [Terriglobales bacterium]|nr:hypothetical protein [Terriglobales bacterium]